MPTEAPTAPAPAATMPAPSAPTLPDFDAAFPDDGLDSPAPPTPPPSKPTTAPPPTPDKPAPAPKPDAPKADATAPKAPADKAPVAPAAEPEEDIEPEFRPPQVGKVGDIRGWAIRMGKRAKQAERERDEVRLRVKQMESQPPKQMQDNSAMAAQLADAQKRLERYESDLRLTRYERSQEYRDKYEQPRAQAEAAAARDLKELVVYEPNPEDPENPRERPATGADFEQIYQLPLGKATTLANKMFGSAASIVLQHRSTIKGLYEASYRAVEEHKGKGAEQEKAMQAHRAQQEQGMAAMFTQAREMHAKRNEALFAESKDDPEGNELLTKGRQFADAVFAGNEGLTPQQVVMRDARAYNWLTAFPRVQQSLKKLQAENTELKATIESIRSSGPGKPDAVAAGAPVKQDGGWESQFDAQVK